MATLITVTTYLKNQALREILESLIANNYHENGNKIMICDDSNDHQAKPVFEEFKKKYPAAKFVYAAGENGGIARNKNRGLKYFFAKTHFDSILMLDDDQLFVRPGLIEHIKMACKDAGLPYMTGHWVEKDFSNSEAAVMQSGKSWYDDFPIIGGTEFVTFHEGSHGNLMYVEREAAEKVGFLDVLPEKYGFEHSLYFCRLNRTVKGWTPKLFPILKFCYRWYHGNDIPNNYELDREKLFTVQLEAYNKLLGEVYKGNKLYNKEHGLRKKKEVIYD